MKTLRYAWDEEIWLLHIEADNKGQDESSLTYSRIVESSNNGHETIISVKPDESYRFMLSRDSAEETGVDIRFDNELLLKIFRLQDRAYLPGDSDIVYKSGAI